MGHNIQARGKYTIQTWPLLSATQEIWGCAEGFGTHPIAPATSGKGRPGLRYIAKVLNWKVLISHSHKWHPRRSSTESPTFIEYPTSHYGNFEVASEFRPTYTCVFISHRWLSQSPRIRFWRCVQVCFQVEKNCMHTSAIVLCAEIMNCE